MALDKIYMDKCIVRRVNIIELLLNGKESIYPDIWDLHHKDMAKTDFTCDKIEAAVPHTYIKNTSRKPPQFPTRL